MRAALFEPAQRLQRVIRLLSDSEEHTTLAIILSGGVGAVSSIVSEHRQCGFSITCRQTRATAAASGRTA